MARRAALEIGADDLIAVYNQVPGEAASCTYCQQPGQKQLIQVKQVMIDGHPDERLPKDKIQCVEKTLRTYLLHETAVCSACIRQHMKLQMTQASQQNIAIRIYS